jgi:hypothetical protein
MRTDVSVGAKVGASSTDFLVGTTSGTGASQYFSLCEIGTADSGSLSVFWVTEYRVSFHAALRN